MCLLLYKNSTSTVIVSWYQLHLSPPMSDSSNFSPGLKLVDRVLFPAGGSLVTVIAIIQSPGCI